MVAVTDFCWGTELISAAPGAVNWSNPAYSIWNSTTHHSLLVAAEPGTGKVVLTADVELLTNRGMSHANNVRFAENVMNWLSSNGAEVLVYEDGYFEEINLHRTPACLALNQFGIKYTHADIS